KLMKWKNGSVEEAEAENNVEIKKTEETKSNSEQVDIFLIVATKTFKLLAVRLSYEVVSLEPIVKKLPLVRAHED
ncbi:4908_t:CDS:1, partial [Cetraspora pellucida]